MKKETLHLAKEDLVVEKDWQMDEIIVLRAKVRLPHSEGKSRCARRFNRYYRTYAQAYLRYCETELFPGAAAQMRSAVAQSRPWEVVHAELTYTLALERENILSIYTDAREEGLGLPIEIRRSDNWSREDALQLPLESFFPASCRIKRDFLTFARKEILAQIEDGGRFYPRWRMALRRYYSSRCFYLTPEGLVWFYPQSTLSPLREGTLTFLRPYAEEGPFLPPLP